MDIFKELKEIIENYVDKNIELTEESRFVEDLGLDSLDSVELLMEIEEHFDVEISDEDFENFKTVKQVLEHIKEN